MPGAMDPNQTNEEIDDTATNEAIPHETVPTTNEVTPPAPPAAPVSTSKLLTIPTARMREIKEKERERGRKLALEELNTRAKALGFRDLEAMEATASRRQAKVSKPQISAKSAQPKAATPASRPAPQSADPDREEAAKAHPRYLSRLERENRRLLDEKKRVNRQRALEQKQRQALQRKLDEREVESELKLAAVQAGVSGDHVDFALDRLRKETAGKTPKELETFNEVEFFGGLRERMPFLFGVEARPVTTGPTAKETVGAQAPVPPKPGPLKTTQAGNGQIDAMKLTPQEFQEHLRLRGLLRPNGSHTS